MDLKKKIFNLTVFTFLDTFLVKVLKLGSFFILIKILSRGDIGIIGLSASYLVFIGYFALAPETIFLRDFPKLQADKEKVNAHISAFITFNLLKTLVILLIGLGISIFLYKSSADLTLPLFFLVLVINKICESFQGLIKIVFYVNFKQEFVTLINIITNTIFLACFGFFFFQKSLLTYSWIIIGTGVTFSFLWFNLLKSKTDFKFSYTSETFSIIKDALTDFTFWNHLIGNVTNLIYNIDPFVLSFFVGIQVIGDYTIALQISNLFFILPMILQKSTVVNLSHVDDIQESKKTVKQYLGIFFLLSLSQLVFFILAGRFIIHQFLTTQNVGIVYAYTLRIVIGVTILNFVRPLIAYIVTKSDLKRAFLYVFLPTGIVSLAIYFTLGKYYGAMGVATGNIFSYLILASFLFMFLPATQKGKLIE